MNENQRNSMCIFLMVIVFIIGFVMGAVGFAQAQTPPVSTVQALPDTTCSTQVSISVQVSSSISWEGQKVGVYWTAEGMIGWNYAGATADTLTWQAPADDMLYQFASTVDDIEGNSEGYIFVSESSTYVCSTCTAPDSGCPPETVLGAVSYLATEGFDLTPDTPTIRWWWTHPTSGEPVVRYEAEWVVDGVSSIIPDIAVGDTTYAEWRAPTTPGGTQTLRARGVDALDRVGAWSNWGDPWTDQGPPAAPPLIGRDLQMVK